MEIAKRVIEEQDRQTRVEIAQIPPGVVLIALRYNGGSRAVTEEPKCWCCGEIYTLDWLQESKGETYAWLKPGCGCLDAPQALACCDLCLEHCQCQQTQERSKNPDNTVLEAATETELNCWHFGAKSGETGRCDCSTCGRAGPGGTWGISDCLACLALRGREGKQ